MRQKTLFSLVVLVLFLLVSGTSYAATTIVYDGGTNWSQGTETGGGVAIPTSNSCGYDGKMRWINGDGDNDFYMWGKWDYALSFNTDTTLQYQVYIPNCNSSAAVNYWVIYGT